MKVEIWSDVMCPFCYVGKKHFENALEQLPFKDKIEVEWKSFQLDPTLPIEGASQSTIDYLVNRKGMPKEQIEGMMNHLQQAGAAVGIDFKQDISIPVNTFRAHRLIHFAQSKGKGNEMEEALFLAHFTEGKNVGKMEVLTELATSIGLDKEEVVALLSSENQTQEVKNDIEEAQALGISGVPFFVVDRKYGISGAQPIDTFAEALTQAYEESQPKFEMKGNSDANACGPDGCEI
ncbi:DsbA family oxidoreductase [Myroides sp. 1354]|uniref:DsbA family oxidoreductase n=1 Tax=unclassified Myroides TaxID=2642485 RepID=UPI002575816D|nr:MULTISPECIES: DsbA family oxidoreductase [unclassified Myroides]MDM1045331.1 DsbA family oxidoreductase [Myroides sp. R163-1]MDM1056432.1 DsbA family oxidoreductase [Myroides sp. 1354]MDM1069462.1 DsbA family oxidoreductase [Myroides sp. 1372]